MLTDAGPLVAILERRDRQHDACLRALSTMRLPMFTILPAFTEAMHFARRDGGWTGQEALWRMVDQGALALRNLEAADLTRARDLMRQYRDIPMDFADAALVAYAERANIREIFTLDRRGFSAYRLFGRASFTIHP